MKLNCPICHSILRNMALSLSFFDSNLFRVQDIRSAHCMKMFSEVPFYFQQVYFYILIAMYFWYLWCCTITTIRNTEVYNQKIQPSSTQPYFLNPYYIRNLKSLTIIKCDFIKGLSCSTTYYKFLLCRSRSSQRPTQI